VIGHEDRPGAVGDDDGVPELVEDLDGVDPSDTDLCRRAGSPGILDVRRHVGSHPSKVARGVSCLR
jgi:hypothetical protein